MEKLGELWSIFWFLLALAGGAYTGYVVFVFCGEHIPFFGYVPIGVMAAMTIAPFGFYVVIGVELLIEFVFSGLKSSSLDKLID